MSTSIVTCGIVEEVISDFTDIPLSLIRKGDVDRVRSAKAAICDEIIGNDLAIEEFCNRVIYFNSTKNVRSGPMSSFVFYGPRGVGKKTVASVFSEHLCGQDAMVIINGADFSEQNSVSRIVGSPPGYIGYNDEAYLLREIRRRPHSVLLIKNVELVHSSVLEQILQIVSLGKITDVHGLKTDFSNCTVIFVVDVEGTSRYMGFGSKSEEKSTSSDFSKLSNSIPILKSVKCKIQFHEVGEEFKSEIVSIEMASFKSSLERGGIIVTFIGECLEFLCEVEDESPSDIRSAVRSTLELSFCNAASSGSMYYEMSIVDGRLVTTECEENSVISCAR
jgi:ATP-dependent Clp protease ATP-binding subunit ClpC